MASDTEEQLLLGDLSLQNGAAYMIKVTAINRAKLATVRESAVVTVDTTPPNVIQVWSVLCVGRGNGGGGDDTSCSSEGICSQLVEVSNGQKRCAAFTHECVCVCCVLECCVHCVCVSVCV